MLDVNIISVSNGFLIVDNLTGSRYVATSLDSFSGASVKSVLYTLQDAYEKRNNPAGTAINETME